MKRIMILLMALGIIGNSFVIAAATDTPVQRVEISVAETGAVEELSHPFLFGDTGIWEVSVDRFQSVNGEDMQITPSQLADLLSQGAIRFTVEMADSKWRLSASPSVGIQDNTVVFRINANHTYGTQQQQMVVRIRARMVRSIYWDQTAGKYTTTRYTTGVGGKENILILEKGSLWETDDILFTAHYNYLSQRGPVFYITKSDVEKGNVLVSGEEIYMAADSNKMVAFDFDGKVRYTTCVSAAQKPVNLYYSLDAIEGVEELYPDIDFFFVSFCGEPSFINSGELTFEAIGGEDTVVYSYDGDVLDSMISVYNEAEETVTIRGIKRLGSYVVASRELQEPELDESSVSGNSSDRRIQVNTESNPSTG